MPSNSRAVLAARGYEESQRLRVRAHRVIPGGAHTYSKGDDQFPELSPGFVVRGQGSHVWDPDGNEFIDWGMGLRSVILGHASESVLTAVRDQLVHGSNFTRPSPIEIETAELLVATIPCAEMVKFAKNGSDVTTAAVKLARACTGRNLVVRCQEHPFLSIDDWFIGDTPCNAGVPSAIQEMTKRFSYNDAPSLERVFAEFPQQVACVVMEPATRWEPADGFLQQVRDLCTRHGALLVFDEIITGFRWHRRGAQAYYGVTPDLATFGKAIGNGFSCSALVGRREVMELGGLGHHGPRVFLLSTTNGAETHSLAAVRATVTTISNEPVVEHVWNVGNRLMKGFNAVARDLGIAHHAELVGVPCSPYLVLTGLDGQPSAALHTLFLQETIRCGILMPYIAPSYAHRDEDVERTLDAIERALTVVAQALDGRTTDGWLVGAEVKPVFRRFN